MTLKSPLAAIGILAFSFIAFAPIGRAEEAIAFKKTRAAVEVTANGQLFTRYIFFVEHKAYLYPLIGPTGKGVTRHIPIEKTKGESDDHPHHLGLWFTHGSVNGIDFWDQGQRSGRHVSRELQIISPNRLMVSTDWIAADGKKVCEDVRDFRFQATADTRVIDVEITIKASEGPLTFGDTKEGSFGIRVAETMKVDANLGGHIENSRGEKDGDTWGKRADWVDYYGPVEGETLGIAIFDHPKSFRHPTYWHVRTYGLFAANPFGIHDFVKGEKPDAGSFTVPENETLTFRYRVLIHKGTTAEAKIADAWRDYSSK